MTKILLPLLLFSLSVFGQPTFELIELEGKKSLRAEVSIEEIEKLLAQDSQKISNYFKVFVGGNPKTDQASILGKYTIQEKRVIFTPLFSFQDGMTYTAKWADMSPFTFIIPLDNNRSSTELIAIYPSTDTLPANQLKLYLHFSAPMSEGNIYQYINIIDQWGDIIDDPFLILEPELWDDSHQRLTLWFDPGRVKRDLGPNQHKGTPLQEGRHYKLIISEEWKDREGYPLKNIITKSFMVAKADRKKPDEKKWDITFPIVHTQTPLTLTFPEGMDHELLLNSIVIIDSGGKKVKGEIRIANKERKWLFYPEEVWPSGFYRVRVNAKLEDLAGNNLNRLFDRDLYDERQEDAEHSYYWLSFEIEAIQE